MNPRELNKKIVILYLTAGRDNLNQPTQHWQELGEVWAKLLASSGDVRVVSEEDRSAGAATYVVRENERIGEGMRARVGSRQYLISHSAPYRRGYTLLTLTKL